MKKFLVLLLCFGSLEAAYAQVNLETPHPGIVVLETGDTITAPISVNLANNIIKTDFGNTVKSWSAKQVKEFTLNLDKKETRYFRSIRFDANNNGYKQPAFFELAIEGTFLSMLRREMITVVNVPQYDAFSNRTFYTSQTRFVYSYFFLTSDGNVAEWKVKKRQILALMKDKKEEIQRFVEDNKLSYHKIKDINEMVVYYNSLRKQEDNAKNNEHETQSPPHSGL